MNAIKRAALTASTLFFLFATSDCLAETMYVTDLMEITMRTGRGVGNKIIAMLESGQRVRVLEANDDWTLVELSDGKQGWVLSRFLTRSEPKSSLLEKLQQKHDKLAEDSKVLKEENAVLKSENNSLKSELETRNKAFEELSVKYNTLKKESAEYIELKASEKEARQKAGVLSSKTQQLEEDVSRLRTQQSIRWFVAGAGVLFVGFLIGLISRRKRRRSSLLS